MNIVPQVVILSAESETSNQFSNEFKTNLLRDCLEECAFNFSQAEGFFEGRSETSFVVLPKSQAGIDILKDFAFKTFKQQAVLYQDSNQEAYLINHDGTEKRLGRLQEVSKEVAESVGSYTLLKGRYYATVKRPA